MFLLQILLIVEEDLKAVVQSSKHIAKKKKKGLEIRIG